MSSHIIYTRYYDYICVSITIYLMLVILVDTYDNLSILCICYFMKPSQQPYEVNVITRCLNIRNSGRQKLSHLEYQEWDPHFQSLWFPVSGSAGDQTPPHTWRADILPLSHTPSL